MDDLIKRKTFRITMLENEILQAYSQQECKTQNQVIRELIANLKNKIVQESKNNE